MSMFLTDHPILSLILNTRIQIISIRNQIHYTPPDEPCPFHQFPNQKHNKHNRNLNIERHEIHHLEHRTKTRPSLHENEHDIQSSREDRTEWISPVLERQEVFEVLLADGSAETEGGNADADPGELVRDADNVL